MVLPTGSADKSKKQKGQIQRAYPAAGLVGYSRPGVPIFYIDPYPASSVELEMGRNVKIIAEPATVGVKMVVEQLLAL